jgi:hypothetical protein
MSPVPGGRFSSAKHRKKVLQYLHVGKTLSPKARFAQIQPAPIAKILLSPIAGVT